VAPALGYGSSQYQQQWEKEPAHSLLG
jgi:hypothetical protein